MLDLYDLHVTPERLLWYKDLEPHMFIIDYVKGLRNDTIESDEIAEDFSYQPFWENVKKSLKIIPVYIKDIELALDYVSDAEVIADFAINVKKAEVDYYNEQKIARHKEARTLYEKVFGVDISPNSSHSKAKQQEEKEKYDKMMRNINN